MLKTKRRHPLVMPNKRETMGQAARRRCLDCNGAYYDDRRDKYHRPSENKCSAFSCPFVPYYLGRNHWPDKGWEDHLIKWMEVQRDMWG
uniref:Uncharacterized protein n=1 Tax=viral metagenome TaxID=1070528 RepID=A0A6M3IKR6_9ZZZZ